MSYYYLKNGSLYWTGSGWTRDPAKAKRLTSLKAHLKEWEFNDQARQHGIPATCKAVEITHNDSLNVIKSALHWWRF